MNYLRLADYLIAPLFEDDDIVAFDKPYGLNTHTNEAKADGADFVEHGLIEILELQMGCKLHIIHRLDQTTTGVVIFGKSQESAKKYAAYFFDRQVKKTYQFLTASRSSQPSFEIDQVIVHKAKELQAQTSFRLLKRSAKYELWQANPHTGRNHQIRIHAKAGGLPLLGDEKYGGQSFPFLCLHNRKIEFPNGIVIEAEPPAYFENTGLLENLVLAKTLHEADRRYRLFKAVELGDQCFRIVHQSAGSSNGFTLDQFGGALFLSWYEERWDASTREAFAEFSKIVKKPMLVRLNSANGSMSAPESAIDQPWVAKENDLRFELHPNTGAGPGLFPEQRLQRSWLRRNSNGKSVLNLFASHCTFGTAAAVGGAEQVVSVDAAKSVLARGKRNFELNSIDPGKHKFSCADSLSYLEVCEKKGFTFDTVVCHAPAFFRGEKKTFNLSSGLEPLLKSCLNCVKPGGELLFLTNAQEIFNADLRRAFEKVKKEGSLRFEISCVLPALDCELVGEGPHLKSFIVRKSD